MTIRLGEFANLRTFQLYNERESFNQARILERLATLKQVNRASDNPEDYRAIADAKNQMSETEGFQNTIQTMLSKYSAVETHMNSIVNQL